MPRFRPDLESIPTYSPGKPIDEVTRDLGLTDIAKLASNECPLPPFPEVQAAIIGAAAGVNRYPEDSGYYLVGALAERHDVTPSHIMLGAGSTQILQCAALASGGAGTSAVFADPSFVMYPIGTQIAGAEPVRVPVDDGWRHDLDAMAAAIREDTTIVYLCNPNNPTGTHRSARDIGAFVDAVPDQVLVVVDEAYHEYASAPDYGTALPLARERDNVIVARTFSKIYGLAGLRIGYAIGAPGTLAGIRRMQPPFSANSIAQAAALEGLRHDDHLAERAAANAAGRAQIEEGLAARDISFVPSQANFVMFQPWSDPAALAEAALHHGVIVRAIGPLLRVSVGTAHENDRLLGMLDEVDVRS